MIKVTDIPFATSDKKCSVCGKTAKLSTFQVEVDDNKGKYNAEIILCDQCGDNIAKEHMRRKGRVVYSDDLAKQVGIFRDIFDNPEVYILDNSGENPVLKECSPHMHTLESGKMVLVIDTIE